MQTKHINLKYILYLIYDNKNQYTIYTKSMKHFLHILVLTFVLVSPLRVLADTVTFDFSSDKGLNALGINKPEKVRVMVRKMKRKEVRT